MLAVAVALFIFYIQPDASDLAPHRTKLEQLIEFRAVGREVGGIRLNVKNEQRDRDGQHQTGPQHGPISGIGQNCGKKKRDHSPNPPSLARPAFWRVLVVRVKWSLQERDWQWFLNRPSSPTAKSRKSPAARQAQDKTLA